MSIFSVSTQKYSSIATEAKARKLQKEQSESAKFQNALANNEKTKDIAQNLQRLELTKDTQQSIYSVKFKDKMSLAIKATRLALWTIALIKQPACHRTLSFTKAR